ncbi:guanylate cyclase domain-containing protein [Trichonephila clavata]|uniref:Guanylate cyclase domain-containing protein n=1 Tax=Trichonephila clavata TaxID=2740835 RepID=A0A8X6LIJ2_TRICU|nr:guanylate cyclase domain-containing protein [Trichonephila clavata]
MCSKEGKYSGDPPQETYCNAAFVPEYVRKIIKKQGEIPGTGESIPLAKKLSGILLTCHIPALSEVVFFYSMSIEYPTEDIAFVLNGHVSNLIRNIMSAGGDIVMIEAGYVQCMWLARKEDMEELVQKVLNAALFIQKRFGKTETKFGRVLRNLIGIACGDFKCFFVGKKTIYYPLVGETVMDSFYSTSQCGQNEVVVSREFWKRIKFKEDYMYQTLPDEFVTVFSLRSLSSPSEPDSEEITQVIHTMRGRNFSYHSKTVLNTSVMYRGSPGWFDIHKVVKHGEEANLKTSSGLQDSKLDR